MRLNESIILGSTQVEWEAGDTRHCAVGMALLANGVIPTNSLRPLVEKDDYELLKVFYPWLGYVHVRCPWCTNLNVRDCETIWHPFDTHVMRGEITLDQLCDWLATLEPKETSCPVPQPSPCETSTEKNTDLTLAEAI